MNKKILVIIGAMVFLTMWLACGSKSYKYSSTPAPDVSNVALVNFAFNPATITVTKGSTVKWTNQDEAPHTVTSDAGDWDSGELNKGQSFNHTFTQTGTFTYHCAVHPSMKGKIVVTE